jgi:DNA polymerase III subunit delta'
MMNVEPLPPWLSAIWARLQATRAADRLAHGLLITGARGVGKRQLAEHFAQSLLCTARQPDGSACGRCADCHLLAAGNHPDLLRIGPDPEAKTDTITIDTIRGFTGREALTPSRAAWKIALIDPADRLNTAAANALLKTLEEPAGRTILCLIGERTGQLPATIRSRCQQIKVPLPSETEALAWLQRHSSHQREQALRLRLAHGAPLLALTGFNDALLEQRRDRLSGFFAVAAGSRDPISEAAAWHTLGAAHMLDWLAGWLCDVLRLSVAAAPPHLDNPDRRSELATLATRLNPADAHRFLRKIFEARHYLEANINPQLLLESLAIDWARLNHAARQRRN